MMSLPKKFLLRASLSLAIVAAPLNPAMAQDSKSSSNDSPLELGNTLSSILLGGAVGGVVGLSTLSFYDRPQDNIRNIFWGAAVGMIGTALYLTVNVATSSNLGANTGPTILPAISDDQVGLIAFLRF